MIDLGVVMIKTALSVDFVGRIYVKGVASHIDYCLPDNLCTVLGWCAGRQAVAYISLILGKMCNAIYKYIVTILLYKQ